MGAAGGVCGAPSFGGSLAADVARGSSGAPTPPGDCGGLARYSAHSSSGVADGCAALETTLGAEGFGLLDGARRDEPRWTDGRRRALLATLTFAGLRLGEALNLRWKDIDLARGTISVRAKTDAGIRTVNILPVLRDELDAYKTRLDPPATALVFSTNTGRKYDRTKVGPTMLAPAVNNANEALSVAEQEPLPDGLTPHSLRRTFASLLFAVGESPVYVMNQMGHSDPSVTLSIYAKVMDRRDGEADRLRALVQGEFRQQIDSKALSAGNGAAAEAVAA
jgi:site-specific recombinase XerD